ncbi:MAG: hypothetical protein GF344_16320 [Chitinivibrionales bacterium]|nr:hypothetical protein [Chitinivibrionales bacterium]MBD3358263.1 hypothetical protein [Chitinivibrionales bacterium]
MKKVLRMAGRFFVFASLGVAAGGCGTKAVITDVSGRVTTVKKIRTARGAKLDMLNGEARGAISWDKVNSLVLDPARTRIVEGKLYYAASIDMDGDNSGGAEPGGKGKCYVDVQTVLIGASKEGRFTIQLADIKKVVFED